MKNNPGECLNITGKTLRSKINADLFYVDGISNEITSRPAKVRLFYEIRCLKSNKISRVEKEWFERGYLKNFEIL